MTETLKLFTETLQDCLDRNMKDWNTIAQNEGQSFGLYLHKDKEKSYDFANNNGIMTAWVSSAVVYRNAGALK